MKGMSFDQLYPGTYLKAGEFEGRAVTLTIKTITREMLSNGSGGEEPAVTVAFAETEKQFVMNKTNAVSLRAMWGDDSGEWIGKRVTLHPVKDESGLSDSGLCIRVKGSPELEKPLKFKARLGRKMVTQTLLPTGDGKVPQVVPDDGEVFAFDDEAASSTGAGHPHAATPEASTDPSAGDSDEDGPIPGMGADEYAESREAAPTLLHPVKVTATQVATIGRLRKASGIYEAEYVALLDSYGASAAGELTKENAEYVLAALKEREAAS
jgi:hypothetical protein